MEEISVIQKVIDYENLSDYENDRLRLLMGALSLLYFKDHLFDDNFDKMENKYYQILDKVDEYVDSMTSLTDEAKYLYYVANMYSAGRFKNIDPIDKLNEFWQKIQEIDLNDNKTEFIWGETAQEVYNQMSHLLGS